MPKELDSLIDRGKQLETEFVKHTYDIGYNLRPKQIGDREKYLSWLDQTKTLLKQDEKSCSEF